MRSKVNAILFDQNESTSFRTKMKFLSACLFLLVATPLCACLWDRDTIAMEAQGRLEVVETMVGWFDRFPAEYYQMRLDRVTQELSATPERLDLYDDAAVSSDRLGRHDEAVMWMEKKHALMQSIPQEQTKDHRYRMHANLGVFRTHQWIKTPERNTHSEKLELAIEEVRAALEINPNAHFGRERAHLALLEWWRAGLKKTLPVVVDYDMSKLLSRAIGDLPDSLQTTDNTDWVKGFCGLIQMGSAQDSLDVHFLVARQLLDETTLTDRRDRRTTLSFLTCLRMAELIFEGQKPVFGGAGFNLWLQTQTHFQGFYSALTHEEKIDRLAHLLTNSLIPWEGSDKLETIPAWFQQTRAAAQQRLVAKTVFMQTRFAEGLHPDTHPDFWQGWTEPVMPPVPHTKSEQMLGLQRAAWLDNHSNFMGLLFVVLATSCVVAIYIILLVRRRRRSRSVVAHSAS